jgi:hypothetical protein
LTLTFENGASGSGICFAQTMILGSFMIIPPVS